MRSIFAKVLVWSLGTFALSLVAYWCVERRLEHRGPGEGDPIRRMNEMVEDDLRRAYEEGGTARLAKQLRKLDECLPGEHILTDDRGRDLVTGADRSDLLRPTLVAGTAALARRPTRPHSSSTRPRQASSVHHTRPTLVRAAQHPAVLRRGRFGHRRHGFDPRGASRCALATASSRDGSLRSRGSRPRAFARIVATRSANCRGPSTKWRVGSRPSYSPNEGSCKTFLTNFARR